MRYALTLLLFFAFSSPARAQFEGPGAQADEVQVQTILDDPQDDRRVTLRGRILEQVGDEEYLFTDGSAQIRIEIDEEHFPAQRITPDMTVQIYGEIEKDFLQDPEIDVERLSVVPAGR